MSHIYLVSDTRERHVHGFIEDLFGKAGVGQMVSQINTGDYLICRRVAGESPEILACIERKTLQDFAASLKDNRYENRNKMMDLRDRTGCQLYFFIEGPAFPSPDRKIARIPYRSILSAITNLMIRDGMHIVQTANQLGTAQRLLEFVGAFEKTETPYTYPIGGGEAGTSPGTSPGTTPGTSPDTAPDTAPNQLNATGVPDLVTGAIEKDDSILATEMWARLTGISLPTAQILMKAFSVADLVGGRVSPATRAELRTASGRQLVKSAKASLEALARGAQKEGVKILSGIPGISVAMATQVLTAENVNGIAGLLAGGEKSAAATSIRQKGRAISLGAARAARIFRLLNYCGSVDEEADETPLADETPPRIPEDKALGDDEFDELLGL